MATNTYAVARRLGAGYGFGADNWSINASYFGRELTRNLAHGSGYGMRGTWAPINDKGNILHFGLAYANYDTDADTFRVRARPDADLRSEEHTSELQSLMRISYAVFCLNKQTTSHII